MENQMDWLVNTPARMGITFYGWREITKWENCKTMQRAGNITRTN